MNYPQDIKSLTGLRFIAAFWLLLYFFWGRMGYESHMEYPQIIYFGRLGVDLFFILSGFVLAHVYGPQLEAGNYKFTSFMVARFARVYPLHIITLLAMVGLWFIGLKMGAEVEKKAFDPAQIPAHLFLVQAWGFLKSDGWNFPSWSISAEMFAYLTFPFTFCFARWFKKAPIFGLMVILTIFFSLFYVFAARSLDLTDMTWAGAQFRILPAFTGGIMLWFIGRNRKMHKLAAYAGLVTSFAAIAMFAHFVPRPELIWPCLLGVVFFTAETSKYKGGEFFSSKTFVYLGEISFAMYMVHLPIDVVFFKLVEAANIPQTQINMILQAAIVMIITIGAAAIAHKIIELPARKLIRNLFSSTKSQERSLDCSINPLTQKAAD